MAKKKGLGSIRGARTASKKQEREMVERARRMKKDATLVLPDLKECDGGCFLCPFMRALKRMSKIQGFADNESKLNRAAVSGDEISKAYAATLLLAISGKAPFLGRALTPYGEALFAHRGKCRKEKLIGVQHYDNPALRLVGVMDLVRNKKLHIYSLKDKMICSGKASKPPREFVDYMLDHLKVPLEGKGEIRHCRHIKAKEISDPTRPILRIEWFSGGKTIAFCQRCAKSSGNSFARFLERIAIPKPKEDFHFSVLGALECVSSCDDCGLDIEDLDPSALKDYLNGEIGDLDLIRKHLKGVKDVLEEKGDRLFIINNRCFGKDKKAFLKALDPSPEETKAIKIILKEEKGPIMVEGETAAKLIQMYWKEYGEKMLFALTGEKDLAEKTFKSADLGRLTPAQILRDTIIKIRKRDIIAKLPKYKKLPIVARFADKVARVYKSSGPVDAARYLERALPDDTRVKAVAFAMLKAMGQEASKAWVFVETERDFANFLQESASNLLKADPSNYHQALQSLLNMTGSTEKIIEEKGVQGRS